MLQDLRYGVRMLLKRPSVTLVAIISLALGIGANTGIFSLIDALMVKSLPVRQPDRLVLFGNGQDAGVTNGFPSGSTDLFSFPFYRQVRQRSQDFEDVAAVLSIPWTVHGRINVNGSSSDIQKFVVQPVSGTYFPVLGINAVHGRTLTDADDQIVGNHPVAVISNATWESRLGGSLDVVGQTITIDEVVYTIVGVAPKEFFGTTVGQAPDVWIPLAMQKKLPPAYWDGREDDGFQSMYLIGRLKGGVTPEQAQADVNLLFKQWMISAASNPPSARQQEGLQNARVELTSVRRGLSDLRTQFSLSLKILMAVVGLVLLIACANVANILLANGAARRKEFAVRIAVGARRARLIRQLLTESVLIATLGGLAGVIIAWWGSRTLLLMASDGPEAVPLDVTPNVRILAFTFLVSLVSAIVFGTAPALRAANVEPNNSLKGGKTGSLGVFQSPIGKLLVISQVALSLVLLVGAGLFVRTLANLQSLPSGFKEENVVRFEVDPSATGYKGDDPKLPALFHDIEENVKRVPGVDAAAFSFFVFHQGQWSSLAKVSEDLPEQQRRIRNNVVGIDYFRVMGIPLVSGRNFTAADTANSQKVAIISELMAQRVFPNKSPLGQRFSIGGPKDENMEVVGVVKDAKYGTLTEETRPMAYYPYDQRPQHLGNLVVRTHGQPDQIIPSVRQAIRQVNSNVPIDDVVTLSDHIGRSLVQQKLIARLASFFGLLALLLACIGLYGLMSYAVARRTNEIGIRMALGARTANVMWLILRESMTLVVIGIAFGLVTSLLTTKTAKTLLFGLKPNDPLTIALASLLLLAVAVFAGYLPARRAARVDPMTALREE
ncbi:MAG TPA: ABC transporter permease [Pyrinomonadaceae bacterium]|nr:ABC transporter permease [Pyrinomonadaceae bacterium]